MMNTPRVFTGKQFPRDDIRPLERLADDHRQDQGTRPVG